jgi:hypothetical protein
MLDLEGFQDGYVNGIQKEAFSSMVGKGLIGAGGAVTRGGIGLSGYAIALGILLPIVVGATAGGVASAITSPSSTDKENLQKRILAAESDEVLAELKRKRHFAEQKRKTVSGESPREIHL